MSIFQRYNPEDLTIERTTDVFGSGDTWVPVELATFVISPGYTVDDNGTLIYDTEEATVSISYWGEPASYPLEVGNKVRVRYADDLTYFGTVASISKTYHEVPQAMGRGKKYRVSFSASLVSTYAVMISQQVCWEELPVEKWIERIRRYVTVLNWDGSGGSPLPCTGSNTDSTSITDAVSPDEAGWRVTESVIGISDCPGNGSNESQVTVDITHTYRGDLKIELVSPSSSVYLLKEAATGDNDDDVNETYTVNLASESSDGYWTLRITDTYPGDTGTLNSWSINLAGS